MMHYDQEGRAVYTNYRVFPYTGEYRPPMRTGPAAGEVGRPGPAATKALRRGASAAVLLGGGAAGGAAAP